MLNKYFFLIFFISSFYLLAASEIAGVSDEGYQSKMLSMKVIEYTDSKTYRPVKEFFFFQGGNQITEREFELIVRDDKIRDNKRKLKEVSDLGFGSTIVLGGMATAFLIPSIVFAVTQTTYSQNVTLTRNYNSWIDYYKANYDYVILPGLINIGLTFVFSVATVINLAVTFFRINRLKYNEVLYKDVIERYNRKVMARYSILPSISISNFGDEEEALTFSLKITL